MPDGSLDLIVKADFSSKQFWGDGAAGAGLESCAAQPGF